MEWRIHWFNRHRATTSLIAAITIATIFGAYMIYNIGFLAGQLLVCPGCNPPQMLFFDHYTIQNNTRQQPCLLTIWFRSPGPIGRSETIKGITLSDPQVTYDFTVNPIQVTAPANFSVRVDTSSQGLYFTPGSSYSLGEITDQYNFGSWFKIAYPPVTLIQQGYTIGYDSGQANATVLNFTMLNVGPSSATLASLAIRVAWANASPFNYTMNGPTISQPGNWVQVVLDTRGSGFHFAHQQWYELTIVSTTGSSSTSSILFQ